MRSISFGDHTRFFGSFVAIVAPASVASAFQTTLADELGAASDKLGFAVAGAGDVNGDGFADVIAGAPRATTSFGTRDGIVSVVSGRFLATGALPARLFTWEGNLNQVLTSTRFGWSVAGGSDVDLDGVPDVLAGAGADDQLAPDGGSVSVFSGATGVLLARFDGDPHMALGSSVAFAGDVNGDGWIDVIAGAPVFDSTFGTAYGRAFVYSGEWIARTAIGQTPVTPRELANLVGTWNHADFGYGVAPLGDLDGDSRADFVVGTWSGGSANSGQAFVHLGGSTAPFLALDGVANGDHFGSALAGLGDVDGDGLPDLCIGACCVDGPGTAVGDNRGHVEVVSGAWILATGLGQTPTVPRTLWSREGTAPGDLYGRSVSRMPDVDLDGADDVAIGSPQDGFGTPVGAGYVDVVSGRDGTTLFTLRGEFYGAWLGFSAASAGDVDGDGRGDLAIGAPGNSLSGTSAGLLRIVRGLPSASTPLCAGVATPNSTGSVARCVARGSASVALNTLFLELTQAPPSRPVVFFRGGAATTIPFGNGFRCAGGTLARVAITTTTGLGARLRPLDLSAYAPATTSVFQAWFDDAPAGGAGFNLSDAAIVTFAP